MARKAQVTHCSDGINGACDLLEHYHLKHTGDKVSQFSGEKHDADIYVVSDPESRRKFKELLLEECGPLTDSVQ